MWSAVSRTPCHPMDDPKQREGSLETLEVVVGQRSEPAQGGDKGVVTAYAGLGTRHIMVVADGSIGPMATRTAPQTAAAALVARVRTSLLRSPRERLVEAMRDAGRAVEEAARGTHAHGQAGCGLVCVYFDLSGATFARVGAGRAYVVIERSSEAIFDRSAAGFVGDGVSTPEIRAQLGALPRGSRIVLLSDETAISVAGDLAAIVAGVPPQLAAVRVVEAARRRGRREALACLVLEVQSDLSRPYHPAVARAGRYEEPALTTATRKDSDSRRARGGSFSEPERAPRAILWAWVLALSVALGVFLWPPSEDDSEVPKVSLFEAPAQMSRDTWKEDTDTEVAIPRPDIPVAEGAITRGQGVQNRTRQRLRAAGPANPIEGKIASAFSQRPPKKAAMRLLRHLRRRFKRIGYRAYDEVSQWVKRNKSRHVLETLAYIMRGKHPYRTRRWLAKLMPELLESPSP